MLLLTLSSNKHIYYFSDIWEKLVWGWDFWVVGAQISHAQVLYINYYEKDKLLLQENKWEQDNFKDQYCP